MDTNRKQTHVQLVTQSTTRVILDDSDSSMVLLAKPTSRNLAWSKLKLCRTTFHDLLHHCVSVLELLLPGSKSKGHAKERIPLKVQLIVPECRCLQVRGTCFHIRVPVKKAGFCLYDLPYQSINHFLSACPGCFVKLCTVLLRQCETHARQI